MKKCLILTFSFVCAALLSFSVSGCKGKATKATADDAVTAAAAQLPEGTNILASLAAKDYEATVSGLAKLQSAVPEDRRTEFFLLRQHVQTTLMDLSQTDPKAAEALSGLRVLIQGR